MGCAAPLRTCIGCRRRRPVDELVRIVAGRGATLASGRTLPGRGAWLCAGAPTCLDRASRTRAFERALRQPVDRQAVADLARMLGEDSGAGAEAGYDLGEGVRG